MSQPTAFRRVQQVVRHCFAELRHDRAPVVAAALTYHTLFSLLPTLVLAMVVLNTFVTPADRQQFKAHAVDLILGVNAADLQTAEPVGSGGADSSTAAEHRAELAQTRQEIGQRVQQMLDGVSKINFAGVGVVGLIVFIYGATGLLTTIEKNFNVILGVTSTRPWYLRIPLHYTLITLAPIVMLAAQAVESRTMGLLSSASGKWVAAPSAVVGFFLATWMMMLAMYVLIPNTHVNKRAAAIGSFVAALVWVVSKDLFGFYVGHAAISSTYGALALLPLFLLWVYLTWLIVLGGLELTHTLTAIRTARLKYVLQRQAGEPVVIDPAWITVLAAQLAADFHHGQTRTADELAIALNLTPRIVQRLLSALEQAQFIHRITLTGKNEGYALARPATQIPVIRLLEVAHALTPPRSVARGPTPAWKLLDQIQADARRLAEHATLADLYSAESQDQPSSPASEVVTA